MYHTYPKEVTEEFFRFARQITDAETTLDLYRKTAESFEQAHPETPHPSAEWFRRHWKTIPEQPAQKPEEPASKPTINADVDLTPADGLIRRYKAFLRLYRNTTDQSMLDILLDATCPEIWED